MAAASSAAAGARNHDNTTNCAGNALAIDRPSTSDGTPAANPCMNGLFAPNTPAQTPERNCTSAQLAATRASLAPPMPNSTHNAPPALMMPLIE